MGIAYGVTTNFQATKGIVQDGLVLNLDAGVKESYNGGTTWRNLNGGNEGTFNNGPVFSSANGGNIVFDGTDDYISLNDLDLTTLTLSCWFKSDVASNGGSVIRLISKENSYVLQTDSTATSFAKTIVVNNGSWKGVTNSNSINANTVYNLVGTYDSPTLSVYTDGQLSNSATITGGNPSNQANNLYIGGNTTNYSYNGIIYAVHIYNRALTAAEVSRNFNVMRHRFGI